MLLTHGARAILRAATVAVQAGRTLDRLRSWDAVLRDHAPYGNPQPRLQKKLERTAFAIAA